MKEVLSVLHNDGLVCSEKSLPALEQYAVKTGVHPAETTKKNIAVFKKQIQALGFSYDWDREINTTDPDYYKWTQWIFLKIFEKGLAYQEEAPVNWCPELKAVLSHEEVADGVSVEGEHPVYQKNLRQWKLKITAYAEALLKDLEELDWPEPIKEQQRNWIGKSQGVTAKFYLQQNPDLFFKNSNVFFCSFSRVHPSFHGVLQGRILFSELPTVFCLQIQLL